MTFFLGRKRALGATLGTAALRAAASKKWRFLPRALRPVQHTPRKPEIHIQKSDSTPVNLIRINNLRQTPHTHPLADLNGRAQDTPIYLSSVPHTLSVEQKDPDRLNCAEIEGPSDMSSILFPYYQTDTTIEGFAIVGQRRASADSSHATTILAKDIENLSFLPEIPVSHSTTRNSTAGISLPHEEPTDSGSVTDAKVQVFEVYRSSQCSLKLVSPEKHREKSATFVPGEQGSKEQKEAKVASWISLAHSDQPQAAVISPSIPQVQHTEAAASPASPCSASAASFRSPVPYFHSPLLQQSSAGSPRSQVGSDDDSATSEFYRQEMAELVSSNRALLEKKEREIAILKDLLQQERQINSYLSAPLLKSRKNTPGTNKVRPRFIPLNISATNPEPENVQPTSLRGPFVLQPSMHSGRTHTVSDSASVNRTSVASSIYYSAGDDTTSTVNMHVTNSENSDHALVKFSDLLGSENTYTHSTESLGFHRKGSNSTMESELLGESFLQVREGKGKNF